MSSLSASLSLSSPHTQGSESQSEESSPELTSEGGPLLSESWPVGAGGEGCDARRAGPAPGPELATPVTLRPKSKAEPPLDDDFALDLDLDLDAPPFFPLGGIAELGTRIR